ncbi:MAG: DUF3631 domain-containing protein [Verrucomicrobia bacterium]|nr:DUF3631 domain-containing protein [Verrucomicrobiota bacterium]
MNPVESFRAAMGKAGLAFTGAILADGELHRFKATGDLACNCWYVLHGDSPAAGAFGCWKRNVKENWCECARQLSQAEWTEVRRRWQEADGELQRAEAERREKARKTAALILSRAKPADASHGYLASKSVNPHSELCSWRGKLVLPLRDATGEIHSLQFIGADSAKRFLWGGRISGCFFTVANNADGPLVVAEGYATAASIFEATGCATVAAMNCGNLKAVAEALRAKCPEREIIIVADNDQFTDGNPGVTKARAAALAIRAKLAVPQFKDSTTKPTDFNDLHQLEGLDTVKQQIESAAMPSDIDPEAFERLAKLSRVDYDRCRQAEAERLGIRVSTLDAEVEKRRSRPDAAGPLQGAPVELADVEPWPEPVDGAAVLIEVTRSFERYTALPSGAADAIALWSAHAHVFKAFVCSPRLNISSPQHRCGKTTLRDVVALFVPRPLPTENLTCAVLFRLVQSHWPTILADEYDSWMRENEELRGLLNAGHRRGGTVYRCEGDNREVRSFAVFAPAVLCGIGTLPGTLQDRSIEIRLERAKSGEIRERFDPRYAQRESELGRKLARWCADNRARIESCDPKLPDGGFNRMADNWRPLFAIAEIAGGDWPKRAAAAFEKLTSGSDIESHGLGVTLLADVRGVFREDRLPSYELCNRLNALDGQPWPDYGRNRDGLTPTQLAKLLKPFKIHSRNIKLAEDRVPKGYYREDFGDAFSRYLPPEGDSSRYSATDRSR